MQDHTKPTAETNEKATSGGWDPAEDYAVENAEEAPEMDASGETFPGPVEVEAAGEEASQEEMAELHRKIEEYDDRLKRLMADYENFRKRSLREKSQERQRGRREAVEALLPVHDSVSMGLLSIAADDPARAGLQAVLHQLLQSFETIGVMKIPTKGESFDPEKHEAIAHLPSQEVAEGLIAEESRSGFEDEIGLLRPAQVVVSSGPPA